jgi:1,4-dihydroxy-6-naphthoate synthase
MEDIQSLNERALRAELEVTAISAHAFAQTADHYWIMRTGASMGEGYGPIIVAKKNYNLKDLRGRVVATPGRLTTANLLFQIYTNDIDHIDVPFDRIIDFVQAGHAAAGLLIHEGQITYKEMGLHKVMDFGEVWQKDSGGLPLPLGLDVVRKDLGEDLARKLSKALQDSIHYGYQHQDEAISYALEFGRGIDAALGAKFVKMYVNDVTLDMGERGKQALQLLFERAYQKKLIATKPVVELY